MTKPVTLSIDAMGGDHGPSVAVAGVALALGRLGGRPVRFLLHGDGARIEAELAKHPMARAASEVRHTDLVIASDEKPAQALRRGKGSSLWNAVDAIRNGEADAAISSGNTGALMAISKLILRMASPDLDRPAIVASWPTMRGVTAVLDVGANITSDAAQLVEFAIMGEAFYAAVHGKDPNTRPTVGLLNVGSEEMKGHEEVREANRLLREAGLDLAYHGFVEGDDIAKGTVDVVVTDGFTGNVALKTAEGMARFVAVEIRSTFTSGLLAKIGAVIASGALRKMRARLDPSSVNGGPLLGLNGVVVKSHGGADAAGFANALKVAADLAASDYAAHIALNMERLGAALNSAPESDAPQSSMAERAS
ncbi:MAG: phosphate acyltransferase PlsX [Caulobacteraceae bacterium]